MPLLGSYPTIYIGVDPGQNGGLVSVFADTVRYTPMPETERDIWDWFVELPRNWKKHAVIEHVHSMPKQGVASSFKFGTSYGMLRMALIAAHIPFQEVQPRVWMKAMGVPARGESTPREHKERLRAKAQQWYPMLSIWKEPKSKGRQLAVADALLLAEYCRRKHEGKLNA